MKIDNEEYKEEDAYEKENLLISKFKDENNIIINEIKPKKSKFKEKEEEKIICIGKKLDRNQYLTWEDKYVINFKSKIIYKWYEYNLIQSGLSILYPERNTSKMKLQLIGKKSNVSDLIKKFKTMNHVLLIIQELNEKITCVYQKDAKATYLNQFVLILTNSWYDGKLYYTDIK